MGIKEFVGAGVGAVFPKRLPEDGVGAVPNIDVDGVGTWSVVATGADGPNKLDPIVVAFPKAGIGVVAGVVLPNSPPIDATGVNNPKEVVGAGAPNAEGADATLRLFERAVSPLGAGGTVLGRLFNIIDLMCWLICCSCLVSSSPALTKTLVPFSWRLY